MEPGLQTSGFPVFKFIERRWRDAFFETGSLRLSTIHTFRDLADDAPARGDAADGQRDVRRIMDQRLFLGQGADEPLITRKRADGGAAIVINKPGAEVIVERGARFEERTIAPNQYIFCASLSFSGLAFARWFVQEKLDSCYVITDRVGFARAIIESQAAKLNRFRASPVTYVNGHIDWRSALAEKNPALIKQAADYEWQTEFRFLFSSAGAGPAEHWDINVPEARQFCRPFAVCTPDGLVFD